MPASFANKNKSEILRLALQKLQKKTPITSIGPGSVARSIAELVVDEIGDLYAAMDFNTAMGLISTAQGRALDLIGALYSVERKRLGEVATIDQTIGAFYFYLDSAYAGAITIPQGTKVYTSQNNFIGQTYTYRTTESVTIQEGRTRAYAKIEPEFNDSIFTAGANTITNTNFEGPEGVTVRCTNPKPIAAQPGYESDDNYRARIRKAVRTSAGGTLEAVRFAGLSINGIRDVKMRDHAYGLGSVEAVMVLESQQFANAPGLCIEAMRKVKPAGVRLFARQPDYLATDITANVILKPESNASRSRVADRARIGVLRYLNTLLPGDTLVYSKLLQSMLDASEDIADVSISRLRTNGREILRQNYKPKTEEQIVPGNLKITAP